MYRYIVVDDEAIIRKGLISKIEDITSLSMVCAGEAANGIKGLELIEEVDPDIIITDMKMTKMDGIEFLDRIGETYPEKPVIVISAHKAFDYVKKAIERRAVGYVLKPFSTEEIEEQLRKAAQQIEERANILKLQKTVASYEQKKDQDVLLEAILEPWNTDMEEKLLKKGFSNKDYYLLLTLNTMVEEALPYAEQLCREYLGRIKYEVIENPVNKYQYFVLLSVDKESDLHKMDTKALHISRYLLQKTGKKKHFICISKVFQGLEQLNRWQMINNGELKRVKLTDKSCIFHGEPCREKKIKIYEEDHIKQIFMEIKYESEKTKKILDNFFGGMDIEHHSLGDMGEACSRLIAWINDYALQKGVETDDIMAVFYRRYLFQDSLLKIQKEVSGYIILVLNSIALKEGHHQENLLEEIQDYIKCNYHKKLTLQSLSEAFYLNSAYCSSLLRNELNKSFNEYISEIRIDKAKKLLRETGLSVDRISNEIGYSNPKYFFKIFKKMTHYSPNEYRNRHIKQR